MKENISILTNSIPKYNVFVNNSYDKFYLIIQNQAKAKTKSKVTPCLLLLEKFSYFPYLGS